MPSPQAAVCGAAGAGRPGGRPPRGGRPAAGQGPSIGDSAPCTAARQPHGTHSPSLAGAWPGGRPPRACCHRATPNPPPRAAWCQQTPPRRPATTSEAGARCGSGARRGSAGGRRLGACSAGAAPQQACQQAPSLLPRALHSYVCPFPHRPQQSLDTIFACCTPPSEAHRAQITPSLLVSHPWIASPGPHQLPDGLCGCSGAMGKPQAGEGLTWVFAQKVEQLELLVKDKTHNLRRLEAQRNELNTQGAAARRGGSPWARGRGALPFGRPACCPCAASRPRRRPKPQCGSCGKSYSCCRSPAAT